MPRFQFNLYKESQQKSQEKSQEKSKSTVYYERAWAMLELWCSSRLPDSCDLVGTPLEGNNPETVNMRILIIELCCLSNLSRDINLVQDANHESVSKILEVCKFYKDPKEVGAILKVNTLVTAPRENTTGLRSN